MRKLKNSKKLSNAGFTLIELLAVITIMGILMMTAIPAVSRTIENSRRDTFATTAHEYINAVRNGVLGDSIECYVPNDNDYVIASATPTGKYVFPICTGSNGCNVVSCSAAGCVDAGAGGEKGDKGMDATDIKNSTTDLMESGGKSSFGNADVYGYVLMTKEIEKKTGTEGSDTVNVKVHYKIRLVDSGLHGFTDKEEKELKRSAVSMAVENDEKKNFPTLSASDGKIGVCRVY